MVHTAKQINSTPNKASIAIVEDDSSIRNLIMGSLLMEIEQIDAFQFKNSRDAIHELWEKNMISPPQIDALFIDIFLEDQTSGIDVLEFCQFMPKDIPVILMSSKFSDDHLNKISNFNTTPVLLRKPFEPEQIIQMAKWIFDLDKRRLQ